MKVTDVRLWDSGREHFSDPNIMVELKCKGWSIVFVIWQLLKTSGSSYSPGTQMEKESEDVWKDGKQFLP